MDDSIIQRDREKSLKQLNIEHKEYLKHHKMLVDMINNIPLDTYVKLLVEKGKDNIYIIVKITGIECRSFIYTLFASENLNTITNSILNSINKGELNIKISADNLTLPINKIHGWEIWSPKNDAALIIGWEYIADSFKDEMFSE